MIALLLNLALAFPHLPPGQQPSPELCAALSGEWELQGPRAEAEAAVAAAAQRAVAPFHWALQPLVRYKLQQGAAWCDRLQLALDAESLSLRCPPQGSLVRRLDDREGPARLADGRVIDTRTALLDASTLQLAILGEDGQRLASYHSAGPDRLEVAVALSSPHLPEPMRWTLTYRRVHGGRHAATR